jgi:hypothetical protein
MRKDLDSINFSEWVMYSVSYSFKGKAHKFSLLLEKFEDSKKVDQLMFNDYNQYLGLHPSKKVSEDNIVKFLNENGVNCVNRKYHRNKGYKSYIVKLPVPDGR